MQKRFLKRFAAGVLTGAIVLTPASSVLADPPDLQSQLNQKRGQLEQTKSKLSENQAQQNALLAQMAELDSGIVSLTNQVNSAASQLDAMNAQKAQLEQQLAILQAELDATLRDLAAAKEQLRRQQTILNGRARGIYKNGKRTYLEIILNSTSLRDFMNRFSFLQFVLGQDAYLVKKVQETKATIEAKERKQEQEKGEIQAKQAAIAAESQRIAQLKAQLEQQLASLRAQKAQKQALADRLKQDQVALLEAQRQEEAEANALTSKINEWNAQVRSRSATASRGQGRSGAGAPQAAPAPSPSAVSSGGWVWPAGTMADITSGFGPRSSPTAGASSNHPGIDIGLPEGTPIVAAHSGVVSFAGYAGGYGNYTVIDNGDGVSTCYGHQSQIIVSVGQQVQAGQVIGYVGSTGVSTGPHLHFEVRVDGEPQNPLNWFGG